MEIDYPDFGDLGTRCVIWTGSNSIQIYNRRSGTYERRSFYLTDDGVFRLTNISNGSNLTTLNPNLCTEELYTYHPEFPLFFSLLAVGVFIGIISFIFNNILKKVFNL